MRTATKGFPDKSVTLSTPDWPVIRTGKRSLGRISASRTASWTAPSIPPRSTLHHFGVRINDPVAVSLPNRAEIVVVFYAVARLGAVFVGINRGLAPPEKAYILSNSKAGTLVADAEIAESLRELSQLRILECNDDDRPGTWREGGSSDPGGYPRPLCSPDDAVGLAYTSGTTGRPKGVIHAHRNLLLPGAALIADRQYGPDLRRGDCAALTILNLQITSTLLAAQARGTQIVMDRVDPVGIATWIRDERINSWFGVPTMLHGLATSEEVQVDDLRSLTDVWTGGSDISPSVRRAFETRFHLPVHATYGMTEVPTVVTIELAPPSGRLRFQWPVPPPPRHPDQGPARRGRAHWADGGDHHRGAGGWTMEWSVPADARLSRCSGRYRGDSS